MVAGHWPSASRVGEWRRRESARAQKLLRCGNNTSQILSQVGTGAVQSTHVRKQLKMIK
jgi:hypothetical protein